MNLSVHVKPFYYCAGSARGRARRSGPARARDIYLADRMNQVIVAVNPSTPAEVRARARSPVIRAIAVVHERSTRSGRRCPRGGRGGEGPTKKRYVRLPALSVPAPPCRLITTAPEEGSGRVGGERGRPACPRPGDEMEGRRGEKSKSKCDPAIEEEI